MRRRFAWVLNLDAELELLRGERGYVPQRKLTEQLHSHGQGARRLLEPDDVLLDSERPLVPEHAELLGRAWCPSPRALAILQRAGVEPEPHPNADVLRRVNHRLFSHELGGGLPGQRYVQSRAELAGVLGDYERKWLLKRPLTFAGRGQLRALGPLSPKQEEWVSASLEHEGLLIEPLVQPLLELSLHGFVWRDGRSQLGRPCVQQVTARGHFQGIRLARAGELEASEGEQLLERGAAVAQALHAAGYFGPFGIDAYRYLLDERSAFCALSEVNARYTLGFVTGFPRRPSQLSLSD